MSDLLDRMERLIGPPQKAFLPQLFSLQSPADRERLSELLSLGQVSRVHNTIEQQINELFEMRKLGRIGPRNGLEEFRTE